MHKNQAGWFVSRIATDWAWKQEVKPATLKLLLLSIADRADEYHCCFPSIMRLAKDTGLNEKTVNSNLRKLESLGIISDTGKRVGERGRTKVYRLNGVEKVGKSNSTDFGGINESPPLESPAHEASRGEDFNTPENGSIDQNKGFKTTENGSSNPTENGALNSKNGSFNPTENGLHNQSLEPTKEPIKNKTKKSLDFSCWPQMPDEQVLSDWLAMRKRLKADVSQTVINRFAKQFELAVQNGVSVDDCLGECIVRNWRGFEFAWLANTNLQQRRPANALQEIKQRCMGSAPLLDDNQRV
ncbi:helix-turn-helix domain-containing protein [Pseudoalteromonas piscicida]|uniref:helix-turn-helix domain-containing protein n=1 Tax=Pseudoalteromonas piscicida TaxID=43662 RepID=UPI000696AA58|nr:helix-turn-helix domain-containing protein [Pseudoalteromonas piscicida]